MRTLGVYALAAIAGMVLGLIILAAIEHIRGGLDEWRMRRRFRKALTLRELDVLQAVNDLDGQTIDLRTLAGWLHDAYGWEWPIKQLVPHTVARLLELGLVRWPNRNVSAVVITRRGRRKLDRLKGESLRERQAGSLT